MSETNITKSVILAASREDVWEFLTDKDKLAEWFLNTETDLAVGKDYALFKENQDGLAETMVWGSVLEMIPPEKLVYTFTFKPLGEAMTRVVWELDEVQGGTKLSLTHSGIEAAAGEAAMNMLLALDGGWAKHITKLRNVIMPDKQE